MTNEPTEMELRVARVLMEHALHYTTTVWGERSWQQSNEGHNHYINMARAAIRAMRVPTTEMMSGYNTFFTQVENWQAIIDAASPQEED